MAIQNNPAALGKVVVNPVGTPVSILVNFASDAAYEGLLANKITVQALPTNTQNIYLGYVDMNTSTGAGVLASLAPGTMWTITDPSAANCFDVSKYYIDADVQDEAAYASAHVR